MVATQFNRLPIEIEKLLNLIYMLKYFTTEKKRGCSYTRFFGHALFMFNVN